MRHNSGARIPWPGPRPYAEEDWEVFSGREGEITQIRDRINFQKLTVLVGGSGTGKTSLVRAGVIPLLRLDRYDERGDQSQWPVLLMRRWGGDVGKSTKESFLSQIEDGIRAIERWGKTHARAFQDGAVLREALEIARTSVSDAEGLAALIQKVVVRVVKGKQLDSTAGVRNDRGGRGSVATEGLILVFDQFEEMLRPGGSSASEALRAVRDLVRSRWPLRLLISMRQEYLYALRELEQMIGGLSDRSVFLRPLPQETILEVIEKVSQSSKFPIDKDVAEEIVSQMRQTRRGHVTLEGRRKNRRHGGSEPEAEIGRPDLLRLQAVLRELSSFTIEIGAGGVTKRIWKTFKANFDGDLKKLFGGALERWIEAAIRNTINSEGVGGQATDHASVSSYAKFAEMGNGELERQVRRIAIRIGPNLSSQDYKIPQEETDLFKVAIGDEVWRLGLTDPSYRDKLQIVEGDAGTAPSLNGKYVGLSEVLVDKDRNKLSAWAKRKNWSPAKTGDKLVICFRETLHRLACANILTQSREQHDGRTRIWWELIHDQFGPSFSSWARGHRDTWEDCESSMTVCSGIQPIMARDDLVEGRGARKEYVLRKISWRGCSIEPVKANMLILRNVRFIECYLVGMVFERCRFEGGSFERCDLTGSLFRDCEFVALGGVAPSFKMCDSSNLGILGGKVRALEFENCELQQPTVITTLEGSVHFKDGCRVAQAYFNVKRGKRQKPRIVFEKESRAFFCSANLESLDLIDYGSQQDVASGAVPPRFFERRTRQERRNEDRS